MWWDGCLFAVCILLHRIISYTFIVRVNFCVHFSGFHLSLAVTIQWSTYDVHFELIEKKKKKESFFYIGF